MNLRDEFIPRATLEGKWPTTCHYTSIFVEFYDMYFAHVTGESSYRCRSGHVPQKYGSISSGRRKLGVVIGTKM